MYDRASQLRRNGGQHTQAQFVAKCAQFLNCCALCRTPNASLTRDHIVPVSMGGSDDISNIQPLCRTCNSSKGNRSAVAYKLPCELKRTPRTDQRWTHGNVQVRTRQEKPDSAHSLHELTKGYNSLQESIKCAKGKQKATLRNQKRMLEHKFRCEHGLHVRKNPKPVPVVDPVAHARAMKVADLLIELSSLKSAADAAAPTYKGKKRRNLYKPVRNLEYYIQTEYGVHV
jgi:hypothetical protein